MMSDLRRARFGVVLARGLLVAWAPHAAAERRADSVEWTEFVVDPLPFGWQNHHLAEGEDRVGGRDARSIRVDQPPQPARYAGNDAPLPRRG
jgi:hypothetical protein